MALAQKLLDAPVQITHSWGCMKILKRKKTDAVFSASVSLSKKLLAKRQRFSLPFVGQKEKYVAASPHLFSLFWLRQKFRLWRNRTNQWGVG